jgi:uncharacterized protein YqjF (DUF2071 family)
MAEAVAQPREFLTARWQWLAMLNYEVEPATLLPFVPAGTELDSFDGITYASMVGFLFLDTRVLGYPVPFHRDFEEVNLRFYVRRKAADGWRRGVVFIKEIVPRRAIATIARVVYEENYVRLPMRHRLDGPMVRYEWRLRDRWNSLQVRAQGEPSLPAPGSTEAFITEHYWGYTARRRGPSLEYRVEHAPWRVWQVADASLTCDAGVLYGPAFAEVLSRPPWSAFLAEGSPVTVCQATKIPC